MRIFPRLFFYVAMLVLCSMPGNPSGKNRSSEKWPVVAQIHKSYPFPHADTVFVTLNIVDTTGKNIYCLTCSNLETAMRGPDTGFDFSGDFECRLTSLYSGEYVSSLFTDNPEQMADWDTRARFFVDHLIGQCANYPDYGRIRVFQLRGMKITLELSDIVIERHLAPRDSGAVMEDSLASFTFDLDVKRDSTATTSLSKPSIYEEPPCVFPKIGNSETCDCSKVRLKGRKK